MRNRTSTQKGHLNRIEVTGAVDSDIVALGRQNDLLGQPIKDQFGQEIGIITEVNYDISSQSWVWKGHIMVDKATWKKIKNNFKGVNLV